MCVVNFGRIFWNALLLPHQEERFQCRSNLKLYNKHGGKYLPVLPEALNTPSEQALQLFVARCYSQRAKECATRSCVFLPSQTQAQVAPIRGARGMIFLLPRFMFVHCYATYDVPRGGGGCCNYLSTSFA